MSGPWNDWANWTDADEDPDGREYMNPGWHYIGPPCDEYYAHQVNSAFKAFTGGSSYSAAPRNQWETSAASWYGWGDRSQHAWQHPWRGWQSWGPWDAADWTQDDSYTVSTPSEDEENDAARAAVVNAESAGGTGASPHTAYEWHHPDPADADRIWSGRWPGTDAIQSSPVVGLGLVVLPRVARQVARATAYTADLDNAISGRRRGPGRLAFWSLQALAPVFQAPPCALQPPDCLDKLAFRYADGWDFRHKFYDDFPYGRPVRAREVRVDLRRPIKVLETRSARKLEYTKKYGWKQCTHTSVRFAVSLPRWPYHVGLSFLHCDYFQHCKYV